MSDVGLFEAIYSQRSFTRYKWDPVPREAMDKVIEAATQAPSGGNRQPWEFIAITDPEVISQVGNVYKEEWLKLLGSEPAPDESPAYRAARYLANHIPEVPAMILVCVDHGNPATGAVSQAPKGGDAFVRGSQASPIWPAIQNLFLAARAPGLGTRLTTVHIRGEARVREILEIPDHVETVMLTPLGYPSGDFGPVVRRPASEVTSYNRYGNRV